MPGEYCRIERAGIVCCDNKKNKSHWRKPKPALYSNIPMLWDILKSIEIDWKREAEPFQVCIDKSTSKNEQLFSVGKAFIGLQPHYLKCLFSYVMFFVSLENTYDLFYRELNTLNRKPVFNVKHNNKKPKRNNYIKKVRLIRNISIAHIGSSKINRIDSKAGMTWQPLSLAKSKDDEGWDINKMAFGSFRMTSRDSSGKVIEQQCVDLEIKGILELHKRCMEYIDEYDEICANYLTTIISKLPIIDGDNFYYLLKLK
jgi:hypothetical protein